MRKHCHLCGTEKTHSNTNVVKSGPQIGQFRSYCKACYVDYARKNPQAIDPYKKAQINARHYTKIRSRLDAIKRASPCSDCDRFFPPECMDFDHVRGNKVCCVGQAAACSWRVLEKEIAKCELVCACCHRIRTKHRRKNAK